MSEQLAYLAGIIDGEGHFQLVQKKNGKGSYYREARIIISNTNYDLIQWLVFNYGGHIITVKMAKPHWSQSWQWRIVGRKAEILASWVRPYLIVKREQVKRVLSD